MRSCTNYTIMTGKRKVTINIACTKRWILPCLELSPLWATLSCTFHSRFVSSSGLLYTRHACKAHMQSTLVSLYLKFTTVLDVFAWFVYIFMRCIKNLWNIYKDKQVGYWAVFELEDTVKPLTTDSPKSGQPHEVLKSRAPNWSCHKSSTFGTSE